VYLVERHDPRFGAQLGGKDVVREWKVLLHSVTGPIHWIAEFEDGSISIK
jgi:hypothetical protein